MREKLLNFIKYNNAFTIIFVVLFFGFGITLAASPGARDSVYASTETVTAVDNHLLVSTDLDNFNFNLKINSVTEDDKNYYAAYSYQTLAITDGIWQAQAVNKTLTVSKEALDGKDLGLYVAKELGENINYELANLKRVQKAEQEKGATSKEVTVEYSGLVGKLLDPKDMTIEGYQPVVLEPAPAVEPDVTISPDNVVVSVPVKDQTSASTSPVNAPLVHDVVTELVTDEASSSATGTPSTTPAVIPPASSTPEVVPPADESTSTPPAAGDTTSAPESPAPSSVDTPADPAPAVPDPAQ